MDNSVRQWGPRPAVLAIGGAVAVVAAGMALSFARSGDRPGALLIGAVAVAALVAVAYGWVLRPRLTANPNGLGIRLLAGTRTVTWNEAEVRLTTTQRLGRAVTTLEVDVVDADPRLFVFGWLELGEHPRDVLAELDRIRYTDRPAQ